MCGACGGAPPDPAGPLVAGPHRRAAVARTATAASRGVTVRAVPGGWTVATRSGRTTVCRTLDALVTAVVPHATVDTPDTLADLVTAVAGTRTAWIEAARTIAHALASALWGSSPDAQPPANGGSTSSVAPAAGRTPWSRTATSSSR